MRHRTVSTPSRPLTFTMFAFGLLLCAGRADAALNDAVVGLPDISAAAVAWGDIDNDGDQDLVVTGNTGSQILTRIYRRTGGQQPIFTDISAGLPGVSSGAVAWADYDQDGDLDLLIAGNTGSGFIARLYRSNGLSIPAFADAAIGLPGVTNASVAWGDYDGDGDLDILIAGNTGSGFITRIYRNSGGANPTFSDISAGLPGLTLGAVAWADHDGDGDLDLALTGMSASGRISQVWASSGGPNPTFSDAALGLPGLSESLVAWADYDLDGDKDLLLAGSDGVNFITRIYRSSGGPNPTFADAGLGLPGVHVGAAAFGDLDGDLDPDLVITGDTGAGYTGIIFQNSGGADPSFTDINAGLPGLFDSAVAWGDQDGDGDLDLLVAGSTGFSRMARVYRNDGGAIPPFTEIDPGIPGLSECSSAWGDYDRDGDLDLLMAGDTGSGPVTRIYRNGGGANPTFTDIGAGLVGVRSASLAWGDFDTDGDLDLVVAGDTGAGFTTRLYRNDGGVNPAFTDVGASLPGVASGSVAWGDCDGDGDLDLLLAGDSASGRIARIYRNSGGANPTFADMAAGLPGVTGSAAAWADYDRDGDLDLFLAGATTTGNIARIYRNDGATNPTFTDIVAGLLGVTQGAVAWGDYDNDRDLDLAVVGFTGTITLSRIYRNSGGANPTFVNSAVALAGVQSGNVAWADYDDDGDLDLVFTGQSGGLPRTFLYRSGGGSNPLFAQLTAPVLPALSFSTLAWGDFDGDSDVDLLIAGDTGSGSMTRIERNEGVGPNTPPTVPGGLSTVVGPTSVTFSWSAATDGQTPSLGLHYNMRVGSATGALDILSPMADLATGRRLVTSLAPFEALSVTRPLANFSTNQFWSVQALDGVWAGGPFSAEQKLIVAGTFTAASDVPNDQGGWLYLDFDRSWFDSVGVSPSITSYGVWRKVPSLAASIMSALPSSATFPPGNWAIVATVPALQRASYKVAVPTISNAAANDFFLTASTTTPSVWFTSESISAQSVDNLAPAQPGAFTGTWSSGTAHLTWSANGESDLGGYRLYRGPDAGFTPAPENLVATIQATHYDDPTAPGAWYKLSAFDVNGNASAVAATQVGAGLGVEEVPHALALQGTRPNPVSGDHLEITFALPSSSPARLSMVDLAGRIVAEREVGSLGPGRHSIELPTGQRLAPGLYWLRLVQGPDQRSTRVTVLGS